MQCQSTQDSANGFSRREDMRVASGIACALVLALMACQSSDSASPSESEEGPLSSVALYEGWIRADPRQQALRVQGTGEMNAVIAAESGFVAVGEANGRGAAWTSVDGETWRQTPAGQAAFDSDAQRQVIRDVAAGGHGLVGVGFEQDLRGRSRAVAWTSSDGVRWRRVADQGTFGGADFQVMNAVTAGGPGFVAVGWSEYDPAADEANAAVWTSPDGRTWTRVPHDEDVFGVKGVEGMLDVVAGSRGLIAVGSDWANAVVWTSVDGTEWTRLPHDEAAFGGEQLIWALTVAQSGFVGVGYDNSSEEGEHAVIWRSRDGSRWSRTPFEEVSALLRGVAATDRGLVAVGSQFVAGDTDAVVWTSSDGVRWTEVRRDDAVFGGEGNQLAYDVAAADGMVVVVGADYGMPQPAVWTAAE